MKPYLAVNKNKHIPAGAVSDGKSNVTEGVKITRYIQYAAYRNTPTVRYNHVGSYSRAVRKCGLQPRYPHLRPRLICSRFSTTFAHSGTRDVRNSSPPPPTAAATPIAEMSPPSPPLPRVTARPPSPPVTTSVSCKGSNGGDKLFRGGGSLLPI